MQARNGSGTLLRMTKEPKPINPTTLSRVMRALRAKAPPESMRWKWTPEHIAKMAQRAREVAAARTPEERKRIELKKRRTMAKNKAAKAGKKDE